ncbi:MAG: ABC transporter ATP-binding protein/permease [Defluviitaleaceae bacterium]|nr:ABC transporter ATP-binding protein/permease [Defluviitaleaceae bacterium]
MRHIIPYWQRYQRLIATAFIFLFIESFGDLLQPMIVSRIIDQGVMEGALPIVLRIGGLMLLVTVLGAGCAVTRCVISSRVSQQFGADLRLDLFAKINNFSFAALGRRNTASLITRMTNDTSQLVSFTHSMMRVFVRSPILLFGAIGMTFILNPRLGLILLVVVPLIALLMYISMKVGFPLFSKMQEALDRNNAVLREYLSGVRVVKAYNTFDHEIGRFDVSNTDLANTAIKATRVVGVFFPIISFAVNMALVATLWLARGWIAGGQMQVGQVVAFLNYMMQITMSLRMIFNVYQMFIRAKASANRVSDILTEEDVAEATDSELTCYMEDASIEFDRVSFTYPGGGSEPVLKDISFVLPGGETLGIIGSTGAGKTSLMQLIPAFYAPQIGEIKIGGIPINPDFRASIAYVAQQNTLFYGTIADNIRMGKLDATQEEIEAAARAAQAHDFITASPEGYETIIGQKGVNLSGGQKQRIGIARALVRKAQILILDDCVSAVDVETEAAIMSAVHSLNPVPTIVMITQRISSVMNLRNILVMDAGRVAGFGNHDFLMETCNVYKEIYHSQLIPS